MNNEKKIYSKLIEISNQISKNRRKGDADWIVFDVPKKYRILKVKEWLKEKRKSLWTVELAKDLNSFYSIDAEKELTRILTEEITNSIENERRKKGI